MYSYDEDDMVLDSKLPEHLAHFGIDMMTMEKARSVFWLFFFCIKSLILKSLFSSDRRLSEQWPSWRLLWTSVSGSGRWFRSRGPPYGRCAALDWPAWGIWATAATSTLSCKCSSLFQTSRASQYPHLLLWFIRFLDDIWTKLLFHIIIGIFLTLTNSES